MRTSVQEMIFLFFLSYYRHVNHEAVRVWPCGVNPSRNADSWIKGPTKTVGDDKEFAINRAMCTEKGFPPTWCVPKVRSVWTQNGSIDDTCRMTQTVCRPHGLDFGFGRRKIRAQGDYGRRPELLFGAPTVGRRAPKYKIYFLYLFGVRRICINGYSILTWRRFGKRSRWRRTAGTMMTIDYSTKPSMLVNHKYVPSNWFRSSTDDRHTFWCNLRV